VLTPSATKHHATSAAVQRIQALREDCAPFLDVTENQEENVKALGDAQMVALIPMMLTGLSFLEIFWSGLGEQ